MRDSGSSILKQQALRLINLGYVETPHARTRHTAAPIRVRHTEDWLNFTCHVTSFIYVTLININGKTNIIFSTRINRLYISAR